MTPELLALLCDPISKSPLTLVDETRDERGHIRSGRLVSPAGRSYPIVNGIPRFVEDAASKQAVRSFGDEWNYFNFTPFRTHWLEHTVRNTFGSTRAFEGKLIVDAGGGSGAQTLWMLESGARHVILLELSHSVDDVIQRNLGPSGFTNYDVVQCSIDQPPLRDGSIDGIVICHNVIQHTPSVERTARALFRLVAPGGEFVFNCYPLNDTTPARWVRFHLVLTPLRGVLRRMPFGVILLYSRLMGALSVLPGIGRVVEMAGFSVTGDVVPGRSARETLHRRYRATVLNTFDAFGSHAYQHYKSDAEIRALVKELQPDETRVSNLDTYFRRPPPIGCALRVRR
jgi:uncharacterized protein YbaR (Trm112 family)/ubiquinone/menaquinone biosynthesis C-methylase UbiE